MRRLLEQAVRRTAKLLALSLIAATPGLGRADSTDGGTQVVPLSVLAQDYQCPDAPPAEVKANGDWDVPALRMKRIDCVVNGAYGELQFWRPNKQLPPAHTFSWSTSHTVATVIGAVTTFFSAYAANRTARHLPLF